MKVRLCNNGLLVKNIDFKNNLGGVKYNILLKKLNIRTPQKVGPDKIARSYKFLTIDGIRYICLPRTILSKLIDNKLISNDDISIELSNNFHNINIEFIGELFPNQNIICDWLTNNIFTEERKKTGNACCTLDLMAGLGKTFIAGGLISRLKSRTLYIVPRKHLKNQAYEDLLPILDSCELGIYNSKLSSKELDKQDVTIIVINSALKQSNEFFNKYEFVIFDEIHMYCGKAFREIFFKAQTTYVMGMTATSHHRLDKFDDIYHKLVGSVIYAKDIPGYNNDIDKFKGNVKVINYIGSDEYTKVFYNEKTGKPNAQACIGQFIDDDLRNKLIVREAKSLYNDKNTYTYIFVENRKHVEKLCKMIAEEIGKGIVADAENFIDDVDIADNINVDNDINHEEFKIKNTNDDVIGLMCGTTDKEKYEQI